MTLLWICCFATLLVLGSCKDEKSTSGKSNEEKITVRNSKDETSEKSSTDKSKDEETSEKSNTTDKSKDEETSEKSNTTDKSKDEETSEKSSGEKSEGKGRIVSLLGNLGESELKKLNEIFDKVREKEKASKVYRSARKNEVKEVLENPDELRSCLQKIMPISKQVTAFLKGERATS